VSQCRYLYRIPTNVCRTKCYHKYIGIYLVYFRVCSLYFNPSIDIFLAPRTLGSWRNSVWRRGVGLYDIRPTTSDPDPTTDFTFGPGLEVGGSNGVISSWAKSKIAAGGNFENFKWPHLCKATSDPIPVHVCRPIHNTLPPLPDNCWRILQEIGDLFRKEGPASS